MHLLYMCYGVFTDACVRARISVSALHAGGRMFARSFPWVVVASSWFHAFWLGTVRLLEAR